MKKILVAAMPIAIETVAIPLGKNFSLINCSTLDEARIALDARDVDLVLCTTHFDESRMFDLLRHAKSEPAMRSLPFLCVKVVDDDVSPTFLQSVEIATRALGADGFIDLSQWRRTLGDDRAFDMLKGAIDELLA